MPTYNFKCHDCEEISKHFLPLSKYNEPQKCEYCNSLNTERIITTCNFVLKGDDWPGKNIKVKDQMMKRREKVGIKQEIQKRENNMHLVPNVDGEEVSSWSEAKRLAESKGKDTIGYEKQEIKAKELTKKIST